MFQAKLKNGKVIIPAKMSKAKRTALKKARRTFYCPVCEEKVILRVGEKVIAHFAHRANSDCLSSVGGESAYHHHGKLLLYEWFTKQNLDVELEVYLPEIKQRPDFLLHINSKKIAIEYQCTKISPNEIIKRTRGYRKFNIYVLWILGEKLLKRIGQQMIKLDTFTKTCIHQFSSNYPSSIFYFCPITLNLVKFQDLSFFRHNLAIGRLTVTPLAKINFSELFSETYLHQSILMSAWKREKKSFRTRRWGRVYGQELAWHQWLYLKKLHIESLPPIIHIPVKGAHQMNGPGWIWQSKIIFEIIAPLKQGECFTILQCTRTLTKYKINNNQFPLINCDINPIVSFLEILVHLEYIERKSSFTFQKKKAIPIYKNLQTAIKADSKIIEKILEMKPKYEHDQQVFRYTK